MVPPIERTGSNPVRARLAELVAIEQMIADSLDGWADRVREHPEASSLVDRLRTISGSRQPLEPAPDATAGPPGPAGSPVPGIDRVSPAASDVVRQIGQVALAAAFACEAAYRLVNRRHARPLRLGYWMLGVVVGACSHELPCGRFWKVHLRMDFLCVAHRFMH